MKKRWVESNVHTGEKGEWILSSHGTPKRFDIEVDAMASYRFPGEQVPVIDHRGVKTKASGSSFSVPRIVAMAVRYLSKNPSANIRDISKVLISRAIKNNEYSRYGWIPDPLDDYLLD